MRLVALIFCLALPASASASSDSVQLSVSAGVGLTVAAVPASQALERGADGAVEAFYSSAQRVVVADSTGSTAGWTLTAQSSVTGADSVELRHEDGTSDLLGAAAHRVAVTEPESGETEGIRLARFSPQGAAPPDEQLVTLTVVSGRL